MYTIPQQERPERVAEMKKAAMVSFKKERKPKKHEATRGSVLLQMPFFCEIRSVAVARQEPITKLIERAWRVFVAFEGEQLRVPLDQRDSGAPQKQ